MKSKTQLSQIQSVNASTFQEGQFESLIDPLNKSLQQNQEIIKIDLINVKILKNKNIFSKGHNTRCKR